MAKYLVETYYTCTFKVNHYLEDINETELKNLEKRDDGKFEVLDVKLDNRKTKSLDPNNKKIVEEQGVADAHPYGLRPFKRANYIKKFLTLTKDIIPKKESDRFLRDIQNLRKLKSNQLHKLNIEINSRNIKKNKKIGIF